MNKKMKKPKIKGIGLIVEDISDFNSFKILISRIIEKNNLRFRPANGKGCGKMKRKAASYARNLHLKGCNLIILIHDLDKNIESDLEKELSAIISQSPAKHNLVCIPKEEIEGWFLSDPAGLKEIFTLKRAPKVKGNPENITSPKEYLVKQIPLCSGKTKVYLNTKHNELISESICLDKMSQKCESFKKLRDKLLEYSY